MAEPSPIEVAMALTMCRVPAWKRRVLDLYAIDRQLPDAHRSGSELSMAAIAAFTGMSVRSVRRAIDELVDADRILERTLPGAGTAPGTYRICPVSHWRVEWSSHPWEIARRIEWVVDVSRGNGPKRQLARDGGRALVYPVRDRGRALGTTSARRGSRTKDANDRDQGRALTRSTGARAPYSSSETLSHSLDERLREGARKLLAVVAQRAGAPIWGQFAARLEAALTDVGAERLDELLAAVRAVPAGAPIAAFVTAAEGAGIDLDDEPMARSTRPEYRRVIDCDVCAGSGWVLDDEGNASSCVSCENHTVEVTQ